MTGNVFAGMCWRTLLIGGLAVILPLLCVMASGFVLSPLALLFQVLPFACRRLFLQETTLC